MHYSRSNDVQVLGTECNHRRVAPQVKKQRSRSIVLVRTGIPSFLSFIAGMNLSLSTTLDIVHFCGCSPPKRGISLAIWYIYMVTLKLEPRTNYIHPPSNCTFFFRVFMNQHTEASSYSAFVTDAKGTVVYACESSSSSSE